MRPHLLIAYLSDYAIHILFRKSSPVTKCSSLFPAFSSISFNASGFMLRSLMHLDLCRVIDINLFAFFYVQSPYSIVYFWLYSKKKKSGSIVCGIISGSSIKFINLSVFMSVPCVFYYDCFVVQLEIWGADMSRSSFIVQDLFHYHVFICLFVCFVRS